MADEFFTTVERICHHCGEEIHHDEPAAELGWGRSPCLHDRKVNGVCICRARMIVHAEPCAEGLMKEGWIIA